LGLSLRKVCPGHTKECSNPDIELSLFVVLVFDPVSLPDNIRSSMSEREASWSNWSIRTLFGIGITSACPLATESSIFIDESLSSGLFDILPSQVESQVLSDGNIKVFDLNKLVSNGINNLSIKYKKPLIFGLIGKPKIYATRYLKGHGNEKGGIVTKIFNEGQKPLKIVYLDIIPWFLRVYLHTLKVTKSNGKAQKPLKLNFQPGVDRKKPYSLEMVLEVPSKSHLEISIEFEKSLLKWLEYPPDANKGFYVNSALISTVLEDKTNFTGIERKASSYRETLSNDQRSPVLVQLYTEALLVNLPTPDFSMPYNVICLTCTVVALAFGPLHNITTKSLTIVEPGDVQPGLIGRVKNFLKSKFKRQKNDNSTEEESNQEETIPQESKKDQ